MDHLVFIALLKLAYKHFSGSTDGSRLQKETIFYFSWLEKRINESQWTEEVKDFNGNNDDNFLALWL